MEVKKMGLTCSCGFIIPNLESITAVRYADTDEIRVGDVIFDVNACDIRAEQSFANFTFDDNSGLSPDRSFSFVSTQIREVICFTQEGRCFIDILGDGLLNDETDARTFRVSLTVIPNVSVVLAEFSVGSFANSGGANYNQEDVTIFGCPDL